MHEPSAEEAASEISDEIAHALHHSWFFDHEAITVTDDKGKVVLSGTVSSPHDRRRAAIAAWSHPSVVDVINDIKVVPAG